MPKLYVVRRRYWRNVNNSPGSTLESKRASVATQDGGSLMVFKPIGRPFYEAWKGPAFAPPEDFYVASTRRNTKQKPLLGFIFLGMAEDAVDAFRMAEREWLS